MILAEGHAEEAEMIGRRDGTSVEESVRSKIDCHTEVPRARSCHLHRHPPGRGAHHRPPGRAAGRSAAGTPHPQGSPRAGPVAPAVLVLRWFLDATRVSQLATDNGISLSTAYRYLHEGIDVLAAVAAGLRGGLLAAERG